MQITRVIALVGLTLIFAFSSLIYADVPQMINYQGKITDPQGALIDTTIGIIFTIYDDSTTGNVLWADTLGSVAIEKGIFSVLLGSGNPIPDSVFDGNVRYLGVKVGADPEMTPRKAIVSVAYAYRALIGDNDWTFRITDGADTTLMTIGEWGIARYGNTLYGNADSTHINLGVASTTGQSGSDYKYCTVGGGKNNRAIATGATVSGGSENTASGNSATVGGGAGNWASSGATVAGGSSNTAAYSGCAIGGGYNNYASELNSTVSGGDTDTASNWWSTVGGGLLNKAGGIGSIVSGGSQNTAGGDLSTVSGGEWNVTEGSYSAIPGGFKDTLTSNANYSMAFGSYVYVNNPLRVIFFEGFNSGRFGVNRDDHDGGISHPIHVGTNAFNGNGAHLTTGGTWTDGSSRTFKENFQPINGSDLLLKISGMPVEAWQYKDSDERHIGPVAEDFVEAFDVGTIREDGSRDNHYLAARDIAGVALAGVKELLQQNQELKQIVEELRQRIEELEKGK